MNLYKNEYLFIFRKFKTLTVNVIFSDGIVGQNTYKEGNTWLFLTLVVNGTTIGDGFSSYVDGFEMPVKHSPEFSNKVTGSGELVIGVEDPDNIQY